MAVRISKSVNRWVLFRLIKFDLISLRMIERY